tara:strand:- start:363 stop:833 length:471 start_codon:yes stop_codon:yes gene_type:complete
MAKLGTFVAGQVLTAAELNAMGGAWTSYTPTWTGITTGDGTNSGGYVQFGRTTFWRARFTLGTTSAITGAITVTLPASGGALRDSTEVGIYTVKILDSGTQWFDGRIQASSTTVVGVEVLNSAGTYVGGSALSSTVPMTWTTSDAIVIAGAYEAAS